MHFRYAVLISVIVLISAGIFYGLKPEKGITPSDLNASDIPTASNIDLTETYTNERFGFSFKYPLGFTIGSVDQPDGSTLVIVQNNKAEGFQISIQPIDEDIQALTVERIRQDLPDIMIQNPQDVILGEHGKGVAFMSDDPTFDGKSREVWFVFNKTLYQIRTYERYDPLLQAVLSTWEFR